MVRIDNLKPLVVAIDVDGTLLNERAELLPSTRQVLKDAADKGVKVVLSTGRTHRSASIVAELAGLTGEIISYTGAMIASKEKGVVFHKTLLRSTAENIIKFARKNDVYALLFINDRVYGEKEDEWNDYYKSISGISVELVQSFEAALDIGEPTKLIFMGKEGCLEESRNLFKESPESSGVNITMARKTVADIVHCDVNKGSALKFLSQYYDIPMTRFAAIGDSENDLEMLNECPVSIAMGNSPQSVKTYSRYVTLSNDEDGIAHAFRKYIL